MRRFAVGLVLIAALGACSEGPAQTARTPDPAARGSARLAVAASEPSASTRMICAAEGKEDITASVGVDTSRPLVGEWSDHLYRCDYVYGGGRVMTLSVKELPNASATTVYFDALGTKLGRTRALQGLGAGAFQTRNGSTVVRKDNRVLLVDDSRLPARFGRPASPRADVSLSVAATIMGCWTGA
jgi:hypothetical protein